MGVLAGKTLPSTIQQRRSSASLPAVGDSQQQVVLPMSRRRELLQQERPVRNAVNRERLGMEYFRSGYLSFTCSINSDLRGLKLDVNYISVLPSPDCHDRSACLFSYLFENVESCEAIGTRLELRFRRYGTKQPTYIALQSVEAQHIRDAVWYLQHGTFKDASLREMAAAAFCSSSGMVRQPSSSIVGPRRDSASAYFEDKDAIQQRIESRCRVIGCQGHSESTDTVHGSEASTSSIISQNSLSHSSRGASTTRAAHARFCEEHASSLASSPRSPSKRGMFFTRGSFKPSQSATSSLIHSPHYVRMLKYQGPLLKKSGVKTYHLSKAWNLKYIALFETPVGGFLCYYDKLAHCPGMTETIKERRVIDLSSVICIRPESSAANAPTSFAFDIVTIYRTWTFAATAPEEYEIWLQVLADTVEKHAAMAPDKRLKFPVKMMTTAQASHYQLTRHESTTLEISSYGVCVCSGHEGEVEIYSWYFTDIQKWSVVRQQGEVCCLLTCQSTPFGKSPSAPLENPDSLQYHEFLFQTSEATAICQAIEFYVGKCMAKLEVLAIGMRESVKQVRPGVFTTAGGGQGLTRSRSEQVMKSATTSPSASDGAKDRKCDLPYQTQHVISSVPLRPVGVVGKGFPSSTTPTGVETTSTGVIEALGSTDAPQSCAEPAFSSEAFLERQRTERYHSEDLQKVFSSDSESHGATQHPGSRSSQSFSDSLLLGTNPFDALQLATRASSNTDITNPDDGALGTSPQVFDATEGMVRLNGVPKETLPILEICPTLTNLELSLAPLSPVLIVDLSASPVPLLESPTFSRFERFDSSFSDSSDTPDGRSSGNDDEDAENDSDRFESFGYLECDLFEVSDGDVSMTNATSMSRGADNGITYSGLTAATIGVSGTGSAGDAFEDAFDASEGNESAISAQMLMGYEQQQQLGCAETAAVARHISLPDDDKVISDSIAIEGAES